MGLGRVRNTTLKVGEFATASGETYYGGSPMAVNKSGEIVLAKYANLVATRTDSTAVAYVGVAANPSAVDANTRDYKMTVFTHCTLTLTKNVVSNNGVTINVDGHAGQTGDDYPYDTNLTWTPGDLVYIGHDGKWTNVNPASGKPAYGTVLEAGTGYIVVHFYAGPGSVY